MKNEKKSSKRQPYTPRYLQPESAKEKRKSAILRRLIVTILALLCGIGALGLGIVACVLLHESNQLKQLADIVAKNSLVTEYDSSVTPTPSAPSIESDPTSGSDPTVPTEPMERSILPQYAQLYQNNPDLFGWVEIEDTRINYPVMHTPYDPEKYIHANFDGNYSYCGLPFLDADCTENSDNLLIYGHNMIDGSMFRGLLKYKEKSYWEAHPVIKLDTLYEEYEYEVMSAFYDRVYYKYEDVFKFYQFIDVDTEQDFDYAIANIKSKQLYNTNVVASFGDQLITLVTCDYHTENGRFVVVARRIS